MSYIKLKKQRIDARDKLTDAKSRLDSLEEKKVFLMQDFEQSYEALTDARAQHSIGEGSPDNVKKAEKANRELKEQLENVKLDIDVQKKAVKLLNDKFIQAKAEFQDVAVQHYKDKLKPMFSRLADNVEQANKAIEQINDIASESGREGVKIHTEGLNRHSSVTISKNRVSGIEQRNFINPKILRQ